MTDKLPVGYERVAVVGCGTMGSALAMSLVERGPCPREDVYLYDPQLPTNLVHSGMQICDSIQQAVNSADMVFLCVRPDSVKKALADVDLHEKPLVSMVAGVTTQSLMESVTGCKRVLRIMPNIGLTIGTSATAYCVPNTFSREDMEAALTILRVLGTVVGVEENQMDTVTAVSGSGPAFFFRLIDALAKAGAENGLEYATGVELIAQTALSSARLVQTGKNTPDELVRAVASSKGTTGAAMKVLTDNDFDSVIRESVNAAVRRGAELAKEL